MDEDFFDLDGIDAPPAPPPPPMEMRGEPPYLTTLNAVQKQAVLATEGPVLVLAGAGTGKTRVLTTRLGHLMATNLAQPWNILSVTFTNKAALEMKERVARIMQRPVDDMWIGTFHSIANRILRKHGELVGLKSNFTILDTDDQIRLLKQLIQAEGIDDKKYPARLLASLIDRWKNKALTPDRLPKEETFAYADGKGGKLYTAYQTRLAVLNAVDFGDLLLHNITLFQKHPDILAEYHNKFKYILVDEYQDTNVAQYLWLRLLAQKSKNICCVGDDDQSIYGWRGAEVGNILRFSKDFEGAEVIRLEQNYRSTGHILAAASALITVNEGRLGKTLWTEAAEGDKVEVKGVWDGKQESASIGDEIENLQRKGHSLSQIAVLVRAGMQMREFEARFLELAIPYKVIGGPRFFERAEIRDAMAYLRVIAQSDDGLAFERIINVPKRGLGKAALQKIHVRANKLGISLPRAARHIVDSGDISGKAKVSLAGLLDNFDRWRGQLDQLNHTELAELVLDESGYSDMWKASKLPDAPGKLDNLGELINAMAEFEDLAGFLEHISLVMENTQASDTDKVSIMTLHGAKGLEFDTVFLPGWEEDSFPSKRSLDESGLKGLEEERRLAYVAITRAKKNAHIYFVANRLIFNRWESRMPSRFIDELPEAHTNIQSNQGVYGSSARSGWGNEDWWDDKPEKKESYAGGYNSAGINTGYGPGWKRAKESAATYGQKAKPKSKHGAAKRTKAPTVSDFAIGERVFHDKFGYGMVEDVDGNKLEIQFEHAGLKKVVDSFVSAAEGK